MKIIYVYDKIALIFRKDVIFISQKVKDYISSRWNSCIKENRKDKGTLIGLPYPYTVPAVGHFDELYYWDTYFTNIGLMLAGRHAQAKNNVDNMLHLVDKYGFMPNGNRTYYLTRSQPPFLSQMVREVYDHYGDNTWLSGAYSVLEKEYNFWMTKRMSPTGLNMYSDDSSPEELVQYANDFEERINTKLDGDREKIGLHYLSVCECGWDINTRFGFEAYNFVQVDLNSLMYGFENNMAYFCTKLGKPAEQWKNHAQSRKELMLKLLDDGSGILNDYNFVTKKHAKSMSSACLYPLFTGVADKKHAEAIVKNLPRLEQPYGVLSNEKNDIVGSFQWGYPNGWACQQLIAFYGLERYRYRDDAVRIAQKYIAVADKTFNETRNLWEKYNVVEGSANVCDEYKMPAMMGWSAGVYLAAEKYLASLKAQKNAPFMIKNSGNKYFADGVTDELSTVYETKYRVNATDVLVREIVMDAGFGLKEPVRISMLTDMHIRDREDWIAPIKNALECAACADQIVLCGDNIESSSEPRHIEILKECVWDPYPGTICVVGNHEQFYGDISKNRAFLDSVWPHDSYYHSKVIKDKILVVAMDDNVSLFNGQQCLMLEKDIEKARKNGYKILIFQHIAFPGLNMNLGENRRMFELVKSNGDIIMAVFSGHNHVDTVSAFEGSYTNADGEAVPCEIPIYKLQANNEPDFTGNVLFINII